MHACPVVRYPSAPHNVFFTVHSKVLPSLQVATFLLGELKQMTFQGARMGSRPGVDADGGEDRLLGLSCEVACLAELAGAKAMLQGEALTADVTRIGRQLRVFFHWLHRMWHQLETGAKVGPWREGGGPRILVP